MTPSRREQLVRPPSDHSEHAVRLADFIRSVSEFASWVLVPLRTVGSSSQGNGAVQTVATCPSATPQQLAERQDALKATVTLAPPAGLILAIGLRLIRPTFDDGQPALAVSGLVDDLIVVGHESDVWRDPLPYFRGGMHTRPPVGLAISGSARQRRSETTTHVSRPAAPRSGGLWPLGPRRSWAPRPVRRGRQRAVRAGQPKVRDILRDFPRHPRFSREILR